MARKIAQVLTAIDGLGARMDRLESRFDTRLDRVETRLDRIETRLDTVVDTIAEFRRDFDRHTHD